jgi:hypothetical protein
LLERRLPGRQRDHLGHRHRATSGERLESLGVLAVTREDLVALGSVHSPGIGRRTANL